MPPAHEVYVEVGSRRVFAGAVHWPGWCRSGRDEGAALHALVQYGPRYARALGRGSLGFRAPAAPSDLHAVERVEGNATTDFGAPGVPPPSDDRPLGARELERLGAVLRACWRTFDRSAVAASRAVLRKGPRGGGRELPAIVRHLLEADQSYLASVGGRYREPKDADPATEMKRVRNAILDILSLRVRGEPPPRVPRSGSLWTPRYGVRRMAWHALDHAWEIEDRATPEA